MIARMLQADFVALIEKELGRSLDSDQDFGYVEVTCTIFDTTNK
jgi:hypothetical protein